MNDDDASLRYEIRSKRALRAIICSGKPTNWESSTMKRSGLSSRQVALLFACGSVFGWHGAFADESSTTGGAIEEIVVTAQKRAEPASEVPQSITAISGDILRSWNSQTLADLSAQIPGLTVTGSGGVGANQIILRGITSGSDISPSVAVYIDDIPYGGVTAASRSTNTALELGSFDLERLEVLRGPQGTLYGAAAFGGLVKYVLTPPSLQDFKAKVQLDGSDTDGGGFNNGVRAAINVPLIADVLAVRLSVVRNHDAGFIDNAFNGASNINASTATAARVSVLAKPADWLTLRANVLGQDIDRDGSNQADFNPATGKPTYGDLTQSSRIAQPFSQRFRLYSVGGDADVGFGTASVTVARQNSDTHFVQEAPLYTHSLGPPLAKLGHPIDDTALEPSPSSDITTVEARLASNPSSVLEWQGGLYYTDEDNDYSNAIVGYLNGAPIPYTIALYRAPTSYKEYAAFGDVTYHFTRSFDTQLGVRFSRNDQDLAQTYYPGLLTGPTVSGIKSSEDVTTYLATARYHFTDSNMAYARIASGYRPGGPNVQVVDPITGMVRGGSSFQPDKLWNYELGTKLALNDVLTLDASVFHIDWKDIQLQSVVDGLTAFVNGRRAKSDGVETALSYLPLRNLTLSATATYTNARLADAVPSVKAVSGERLPNAPRISAAIRADYRMSLGNDWTGIAGASWSYIGNRTVSYDASVSPLQYDLPKYQTVDLRLGADHGSLGLSVYLRNVGNTLGQISADTTFNLPNYRISVIEPRTVGALLTYSF
jgi:iron complex outermembrane receptor protein